MSRIKKVLSDAVSWVQSKCSIKFGGCHSLIQKKMKFCDEELGLLLDV